MAYFELRAHELLNASGQTGIIGTNTLAQGDTREVGLDQLESQGVVIRRAIKSAPWPSSSAVLEYCAVWTSKAPMGVGAVAVIGSAPLPNGISTNLTPVTRERAWTMPLMRNAGIAFQGSIVLGLGFTLLPSEAQAWIAEEERYAEVLFPYIGGQDVNNHRDHGAERWVINFHDWSEDDAMGYAKAYGKILADVKPERQSNKINSRKEKWWQYAARAAGLYETTSLLDRCIVMAQVSKVVMPVLVSTGQVFDQKLVVFGSDDTALLALLSSAAHYWWAIDRSSTMKADLSYSPSDVFTHLVRPRLTPQLRTAGARLAAYRRDLMLARNMGLTATYNLVHNPACHDEDISELRRIHEEIDRATVEAYGWFDLLDDSGRTPHGDPTHETFLLDHGFHQTDQGPRYTIGLLARTEIIDRLRQLNHQAYADEVCLGLHKKPAEHPDMPKPSAGAIRKRKEQLAARGGSDFGEGADGALF